MVIVDSGPITADQGFGEIPKDKWINLMWEKRDFISVNLNYDCRNLIQFVSEANDVYRDLGFESVDDMIRDGYELKPEDIHAAVDWLERNKPEWAMPLNDVLVKVRQHHEWTARHEDGESFRSIAKDAGVDDKTVAHRVRSKPSYNTKNSAPKRKVIGYRITEYTKPETAAVKIRAIFGDTFANDLSRLIRVNRHGH